jgi:hypothetical protein
MKPARSARAPQQVAENKAKFKIPAVVKRHPQPIGASPSRSSPRRATSWPEKAQGLIESLSELGKFF